MLMWALQLVYINDIVHCFNGFALKHKYKAYASTQIVPITCLFSNKIVQQVSYFTKLVYLHVFELSKTF